MIAILYFGISTVSRRLIEAELLSLARPWARQLPQLIVNGGSNSDQSVGTSLADALRFGTSYTQADAIFVTDIAGGTIESSVRSSDSGHERYTPPLDGIQRALSGRIWTDFRLGGPAIFRTAYGEVTAPLIIGDTVIGTVHLSANMTERWSQVEDVAQLIALASAVLMLTFILLILIYSRRRISEDNKVISRVDYLVQHDQLTDLPNRAFFETLVGQALERSGRLSTKFGVIFLNIDGFREINDSFGHSVGDIVLRKISHRISRSIRYADRLARIGGDEFSIVTDDVHSPEELNSIVRSVQLAGSSIKAGKRTISCTLSAGVAVAPTDGGAVEDILNAAALALERAKADGVGNERFFEAEMDEVTKKRRVIASHLRIAVKERALELNFQPQHRLGDRQLVGFEALIRWNHPEFGYVPPSVFIPIAEDIQLIPDIGEWTIYEACRQAELWSDDVRIAVNVSPAQFGVQDVAEIASRALRKYNLPSERLELEITESMLLDTSLTKAMDDFKSVGIRVAMDDFGSGYSSLNSLSQIDFDKLKIDQAFTKRLGEDEGNDLIVQMVIGLGDALGVAVLAEGIETTDQEAALMRFGCDEGQGYLYSRPISGADSIEYVKHYQARGLTTGSRTRR